MTRGKHAASASKRRADAAEARLAELLPQLAEAKRIAHQYRSEADRVPVLTRQLAELRDAVGIPVADHEAALRQVEAERERVLDAYDDAVFYIFDMLARTGVFRERQEIRNDVDHINQRFIAALYVLPHHVTEPLVKALGWERWLRRAAITTRGIELQGYREHLDAVQRHLAARAEQRDATRALAEADAR